MNTSKEQLLSDKPLCAWWSTVVGDDRFDKVLLHAKGMAFEGKPSPDQIQGIVTFIQTLTTIAESEESAPVYPEPGLSHSLDVKRRTITKSPDKKKA